MWRKPYNSMTQEEIYIPTLNICSFGWCIAGKLINQLAVLFSSSHGSEPHSLSKTGQFYFLWSIQWELFVLKLNCNEQAYYPLQLQNMGECSVERCFSTTFQSFHDSFGHDNHHCNYPTLYNKMNSFLLPSFKSISLFPALQFSETPRMSSLCQQFFIVTLMLAMFHLKRKCPSHTLLTLLFLPLNNFR